MRGLYGPGCGGFGRHAMSSNTARTLPDASPCSGPDSVASPVGRQPASDAPVDAVIRAANAELVIS